MALQKSLEKGTINNMKYLFLLIFCIATFLHGEVTVGVDVLFSSDYSKSLSGKRVGLLTNHTAVNRELKTTLKLLKENTAKYNYRLTALFAPEHGITGSNHSEKHIQDSVDTSGIPIYSLHGTVKKPTKSMLKQIDILIYDIQDVGSRSYTYNTTLFYAMEEAAKHGVEVMVLDRPNPINGITVDGPMMEDEWRSFVGYINVPYCHGMTVGELAKFFNSEYKIDCKLTVVPMKGWNRSMSFKDTGLTWIPTSPQIPESTTPWYYPTTGILGELQIVNIGVGYTLPFKVVGAPWIDADQFSRTLNSQNYPGVTFQPFHYTPYFGRFAKQECHGIFIVINNPQTFKPVSTQYLIIGMLKHMYPDKFKEAITAASQRKEMFCKVNGTEEVYNHIIKSKAIAPKLRDIHKNERQAFLVLRKKYLLPDYL